MLSRKKAVSAAAVLLKPSQCSSWKSAPLRGHEELAEIPRPGFGFEDLSLPEIAVLAEACDRAAAAAIAARARRTATRMQESCIRILNLSLTGPPR